VGLKSLKSLNLTNGYPNNNNNNNNKVKSKPLELRSRVKIGLELEFGNFSILHTVQGKGYRRQKVTECPF
jgi:hypothetical protein